MPVELIQTILKNYRFGNFLDFQPIALGVSDENYKVETTQGVYFLKKHRPSATARIESIERLEKLFSAAGLPVILPLAAVDHSLHHIYDGYSYVLYPFVTGKVLAEREAPVAALENMAEHLAGMHLLSKDGITGTYSDVSRFFLPSKSADLLKQTDKLLAQISEMGAPTDYDRLAAQGLLLKKDLINRHAAEIDAFSFGRLHLCHGDYHPQNLFFSQANKISAIFDFDMAGPQPREYELARAIMITCFDNIYSDDGFQRSAVFIKKYHDIYPFTKEDFQHGLEAFYLKTLGVWRERAHYWDGNTRTDYYYALSLDSTRYLAKHRHELADKLYSFTH
jgi:Ser/Thr protein kinase RdoA (MazF antagonist)